MVRKKREFDEFQIKKGETLDGKDLMRYSLDKIKGKDDPIWAIQNILGFGDMFPWQEDYARLFYRHIYDPDLLPVRDAYIGAGQRCASNCLLNSKIGLIYIEELYPDIEKIIGNPVNVDGFEVFNGKNWSVVDSVVYAGKKSNCIVTTEYGFRFTCSEDHKLWVFNGLEYSWKRVIDIRPGEYLEGYRGLASIGTDVISDTIKEKMETSEIENKSNCTLPTRINTDIACLMGMLIADGSINNPGKLRLTKGDPDIVGRFCRIVKDQFNLDCAIYSHNNSKECKSVEIYCEYVRYFLYCIGLDYSVANTKEIPKSIRCGTKELKIAFLSGYFSCDGGAFVAKSGNGDKARITITSVSEKLAYQVQCMLLELDILSSISVGKSVEFNSRVKRENNAYTINIFGKEIVKFRDKIRLIPKYKQDGIELCHNNVLNKKVNGKRIPLSKEIVKKHFRQSNKLHTILYDHGKVLDMDNCIDLYDNLSDVVNRAISNNRIYLKIKSVEFTDEEVDMYDISVPDGNCYVGNGILSHNSGKTVWAAMIGSYDFFNVVTIPDPQKFFGVKDSQKLFATVMSTSGKLAEDGVYAHMINAIENSEWMNQWYDIKSSSSPIPQIGVEDKYVYAQVLGSWANTAVGRTNYFVGLDEIDYFEESTSKRAGMEVYSRMTKSRDTLGDWGHLVAISSLKSSAGPIATLAKVAMDNIASVGLENSQMIGFIKPVWELNPNPEFSYEVLSKRYAHDPISMWRDYGCRPEMAGGLQFPEGILLDETLPNVFEDIEDIQHPKSSAIHTMSIDPAATSDKFGISIGYKIPFGGQVIDGVTYFKKKVGNPFIMPSDVWKFVHKAIPICNIGAFIYDTYMFMEVLERVRTDHGITPIKHIVTKEDYDAWRSYQSPLAKHPSRVCYCKELKDEADQLIVKEGKRGHEVNHLWNKYKDMSDSVANLFWYFNNYEVQNVVPAYFGARVF